VDSFNSPNSHACLFVQVLASSRVFWISRLPGHSGSGSARISAVNVTKPTAQFYEGRLSTNNSLLTSTSLLGVLGFTRNADGNWRVVPGSEALPAGIERQGSKLKRLSRVAVFDGASFQTGVNATGAEPVDFASADGALWRSNLSNSIAGMPPVAIPLKLTVQDPLLGEGTRFYNWQVMISPAGVAKATVPVGQSAPALTLHLNITKGEWTGSYLLPSPGSAKFVRRTLEGVSLAPDSSNVLGRGWVEAPASSGTLNTGNFKIER
jgi:hypothetical protein